MMHGREKSDSAIVAVKPTNKAVPGRSDDVRSPGQTESYRRRVKPTLLTHLYGPAVRCKPNVNKWRWLVLRICIRPLHGAFVLLAIMDIRAYPISFSERPLEAAWVTRSRVRRRDRFSISSIQLAA